MARKRHRGPTLGSIIHSDSSGRKTGYSERNILGGYVDYDRHGRIVGYSESDGRGGYDHYDGWGSPAGHSGPGEYVHNPHDDFFKTGSYDYKTKRKQAASTSSSPPYSYDFKPGEIPQPQPVPKNPTPSQPVNNKKNIDDFRRDYAEAKKRFLAFVFILLCLGFCAGVALHLDSNENTAQILILFLSAAFFICLGLSSACDDFTAARCLLKEAERLNRIENAPKDEPKKKAPEEQKPVVSNHAEATAKPAPDSGTLSGKSKSAQKKESKKPCKKAKKKPARSLWNWITKTKECRILLLKTGLAGSQFHIKSEAERAALHHIQPGTELILRREPDNKYDKWAIAVYLTEEDQIGFLSRFKNETIARLMDAGKKCIAVADDPAEQNSNDAERSRKAPTENMDLPFSVYLLEDAQS